MTSTMALSLLQDAQTRGLAAALAGIKREEDNRNLTMSPPTQHHHHHHHQTPVYPGLHHAATASALGMLSPSQLMAANRTAAAFMAAQLPMTKLASVASLFPHHPALFGSWGQSHAMTPPAGPHSPPTSPISPSSSSVKKLNGTLNNNNNNSATNNNNNNNNSSNTNNNIVSTTLDVPAKKTRKISVKKDLMSPPIDIPTAATSDIYNSGPISPPSSGSSPNSQQDISTVHTKDPSRDKSFTCKICNRSFGYKHVLQNHERTHTGEKPFECPECHKRFTRDHHLKTHMRLHTGEKPYHCSHCDRQFVQVANLRRHLRVHTGERPYNCDMCNARFSDSNQLKSHQAIHNGEKPFECERCHLKFRRRHHLMHHKCGIQSPPTPAISPAMSDYGGMSEQKSTISSFASDESSAMDKSVLANSSYEDGVLTAATVSTIGTLESEKRSRKSTDIRRVVRLPPQQIIHVATDLPEQTEPEDLSIRSPRSHHSPAHSLSTNSIVHDDDLEDLDDAATLHFKQQRQRLMQAAVAAQQITTSKWHLHNNNMEHD